MGLFFNYDKPGKGVDKNAPKKWGVFLYFELLWRNLGKIIKTNAVYTLVSLPVLAFYFVSILYFMSPVLPVDASIQMISRLAVILAVLWAIFLGTGPMSCGFTYVLRNFARDEHVWPISDLFEKTKENFVKGLIIFIVDIVVVITGGIAVWVYWNMAQGGNSVFLFLMMTVLVLLAFYAAMHFYLYQFVVTFDNKLSLIYKNSAFLALATFPMCLFLMALTAIITFLVCSYISAIGIALLAILCWIGFMRFVIDFYSARLIKRKFIKEESDE